jgi:hypothetical protein
VRWLKVTSEVVINGLTVTVKVPLAVFPTLSVAVAVTVVVPIAKVPPLAGAYVRVGVPTLSVALAPLKVTVAPFAEVALTVMFAGRLSTGGVVSTRPATDCVPMLDAAGRARAKRKPRFVAPTSGGLWFRSAILE